MFLSSRHWMKLLAIAILAYASLTVTAVADSQTLERIPQKSVSEFVAPDGRIDLEAARTSGFQGSLDLRGFDVRLDPASGEPTANSSAGKSPQDDPDDIYWDNSLTQSFPGVNGMVYAVTVFDNKLIAGGSFSTAGSATVNNIAAWDGANWSTLGSGLNDTVTALTVYNGKLIAGGWFTTASGVSASRVAAWDGSSWSPLGLGVDNVVRALAINSNTNRLIVGGSFATAGSVSALGVAYWNGSAWSALGTGLPGVVGNVYAVAFNASSNQVIVGGDFSQAGMTMASKIAAWNGAAWLAMGAGMDDTVRALTIFGSSVVAGGDFGSTGGPYSHVASWNGASWSALGTGTNGRVSSLTTYNGNLVAGGGFSTADGTPANHIATWNGSSWSALGSGVGDVTEWVNALTAYDSKLVAGGNFSTAGGVTANFVAFWNGSGWSPLVNNGFNGGVLALTVYDGKLIAAGSFSCAPGVTANNIASWDGSAWSALGSGTNGIVRALTVW